MKNFWITNKTGDNNPVCYLFNEKNEAVASPKYEESVLHITAMDFMMTRLKAVQRAVLRDVFKAG